MELTRTISRTEGIVLKKTGTGNDERGDKNNDKRENNDSTNEAHTLTAGTQIRHLGFNLLLTGSL